MIFNLPDDPGKFGAIRRHDIHTGIDLYCNEGAAVYAIERCRVTQIIPFTGPAAESPWWNETWAIVVAGELGYILYGEILPNPFLKVGQQISEGYRLGWVEKVLKHDKGRPMTMLHLELYDRDMEPVWWDLNTPQPEGLLDPTKLIINLMSSNE